MSRNRTDSLAEMGHALMSHLESKSTRAVIAAPTLALAREVMSEVVVGWPLRFSSITLDAPTGPKAEVVNGGTLWATSLERPRNFDGRQCSYAVVVLTSQLADILDSLEALNLGLRLGDAPRQVQYVDRRQRVTHTREPKALPVANLVTTVPMTGAAGDAHNMDVIPAYDPAGCPKCGGTWPTACSCPPGTEYLFSHGPSFAGTLTTLVQRQGPPVPHRQVKLESGHVVCIDCLYGSFVAIGPQPPIQL